MTYEVRGMLETMTSYDNAIVGSGTILNQTLTVYNDFEQPVTEYQSQEGAVNTSTTPNVQYMYEDGSASMIRQTKLIYPNGRPLTFGYGPTGRIDDSVSRVASLINDDNTDLVEYQYLGMEEIVVADDIQPQTKWTLVSLTETNDLDTGDIYSGLDRFGRTKDCRWYNTDIEEDTVRLKYGYGRNSNKLWRQDDMARAQSQPFDELYAYDNLQRLKAFGRGTSNAEHSSMSDVQYQQCWDLDSTENWSGMKQAVGGTAWTLEQSRDANTVNEITDITHAVGPVWSVPVYDPAGNMRKIPKPDDPTESFTGDWDAWNRLVKLVDDETEETVAEYQYDAMKRRIIKKLYTSGLLSQTRHIYVSGQNQILEERIDSSTDPTQQNLWGIRYIDDLILRDRTTENLLDERLYCFQDVNWNVVALTNDTGGIAQRFAYNPYGTSYVLTTDFTATTDSYSWTTRLTGRELDLESSLYQFRARYLHTSLGVFISWDPLGYADGNSLYAAYFVPNKLDPSGAITCYFICAAIGVLTCVYVPLVTLCLLMIISMFVCLWSCSAPPHPRPRPAPAPAPAPAPQTPPPSPPQVACR